MTRDLINLKQNLSNTKIIPYENNRSTEEANRKEHPTTLDIRYTKNLLGDFGINISISSIPKFPNMYGLYHWRLSVIQNYLKSFN